eukprot:Skav235599  [mRNA]  locus=scaffold3336:38806:50212:+ [translate_table: standard]
MMQSLSLDRDSASRWPSILAQLQWEFQADSGAKMRILGADKNASVVNRLDRLLIESPQGKRNRRPLRMAAAEASHLWPDFHKACDLWPWRPTTMFQRFRNARDQHMMTTILRLRGHSRELFGLDEKELPIRCFQSFLRCFLELFLKVLELSSNISSGFFFWMMHFQQDLKIIVWAHNSHVGDATATPMGGMDFQRNEPLAQNEIYVQLFQTPDEAEEEDNIRKLRKVAAAVELPKLIQKGNLLAPLGSREGRDPMGSRNCMQLRSSRPKSEKNGELMRQQGPGTLAARLGWVARIRCPMSSHVFPCFHVTRLGHFTEAVYIISLPKPWCEPYNPNKRGGGAVTDATLSFSSWDQEVASWERVVDRSIVARESEYST